MSLRKVWVVVHGEEPPQGEIENAEAIAEFLRSNFNIVRVLPANAMALDLLARFCNFVTVGGPFANEWAFKLNEYLNPRYNIVVHREKTPEETWVEYVTSGAFEITGFLKDDTPYEGVTNMGMIGVGAQPYMRARPLEIVHIGGWAFEDTCTMGKAFIDGAGAGIFTCTWPEVPVPEEHCPEEVTYTKIADP